MIARIGHWTDGWLSCGLICRRSSCGPIRRRGGRLDGGLRRRDARRNVAIRPPHAGIRGVTPRAVRLVIGVAAVVVISLEPLVGIIPRRAAVGVGRLRLPALAREAAGRGGARAAVVLLVDGVASARCWVGSLACPGRCEIRCRIIGRLSGRWLGGR